MPNPNKKNTFLFFLLLSSLFLGAQSDTLIDNQLYSSCLFYDSLEVKFQCGKKGYPINYGKRFCLKFSNKRNRLSDEGKEWLDSTRHCLQQSLYDLDPNLSCKALRKKAFDSHIPCYLDNGYCGLDKKDRKLVIKTIFLSSLVRPRTWRPGLKVLRNCGKERRKRRKQE